MSNGLNNYQIKIPPSGSYMKSAENSKEFFGVLNKTKTVKKRDKSGYNKIDINKFGEEHKTKIKLNLNTF